MQSRILTLLGEESKLVDYYFDLNPSCLSPRQVQPTNNKVEVVRQDFWKKSIGGVRQRVPR